MRIVVLIFSGSDSLGRCFWVNNAIYGKFSATVAAKMKLPHSFNWKYLQKKLNKSFSHVLYNFDGLELIYVRISLIVLIIESFLKSFLQTSETLTCICRAITYITKNKKIKPKP